MTDLQTLIADLRASVLVKACRTRYLRLSNTEAAELLRLGPSLEEAFLSVRRKQAALDRLVTTLARIGSRLTGR